MAGEAKSGGWAPAGHLLLFPVCLLSGTAGLIYEVGWTRLFSLVVGSSAPAQATVVAAFLGGLSGGAWLGGWLSARFRRPLLLFAGLELASAGAALLVPLALSGLEPAYGAAPGPVRPGKPGCRNRCLFLIQRKALLRLLLYRTFSDREMHSVGAPW